MRHNGRVEREWAAPWLRTVVRHEAMAITGWTYTKDNRCADRG